MWLQPSPFHIHWIHDLKSIAYSNSKTELATAPSPFTMYHFFTSTKKDLAWTLKLLFEPYFYWIQKCKTDLPSTRRDRNRPKSTSQLLLLNNQGRQFNKDHAAFFNYNGFWLGKEEWKRHDQICKSDEWHGERSENENHHPKKEQWLLGV